MSKRPADHIEFDYQGPPYEQSPPPIEPPALPSPADVHWFAVQQGHATGYGPVEYSHGSGTIVLLDGIHLVRATDPELAARGPAGARAALAHRFCVAKGYVAGFGPVARERDENVLVALATGQAILEDVSDATLNGFAPAGDIIALVHRYARSKGYLTGIRVEWSEGHHLVVLVPESLGSLVDRVPFSKLYD